MLDKRWTTEPNPGPKQFIPKGSLGSFFFSFNYKDNKWKTKTPDSVKELHSSSEAKYSSRNLGPHSPATYVSDQAALDLGRGPLCILAVVPP